MQIANLSISSELVLYMTLFMSVILLIWLARIEIRFYKLFRGKKAQDFESLMFSISEKQREFGNFREEISEHIKSVEKRLKNSVQGLATVRFNPFKGTGDGGNQSFATAFVDEAGDGVVISSLYARNRVSVFAKPLRGYASDFELTVEEKNAIDLAKEKAGKK